jgi:hypothetical protein
LEDLDDDHRRAAVPADEGGTHSGTGVVGLRAGGGHDVQQPTHRVAISNQRLVAFDERGVTFRWKDYRAKGRTRYKTMTLETGEFMRRFLLHVLPGGFHRIRHYGLLANPVRRANLTKVRELLDIVPELNIPPQDALVAARPAFVCRHCGAPMIVIEILERTAPIRAPPIRRGET